MYYDRIQSGIGSYDFILTDFTKDGAWHLLDLSAIIPVNASGISIHVKGACTTVDAQSIARFRGGDVTHSLSTCKLRPQVNGRELAVFFALQPDSSRRIWYQVLVSSWTVLDLTVQGWWIP